MTRARIISHVKLQIPTAREFDVNKHIDAALIKFNTLGIDQSKDVRVEPLPTGTYDHDPANRTETQTFNYYPDLRCLILPSSLNQLSTVNIGITELDESDMDSYQAGVMQANAFVANNCNELYLSTDHDLAEGDVVRVRGLWSIRDINVLPDRFEDWLLKFVLAGMYNTPMYKDKDQFMLNRMDAEKAWLIVRGSQLTIGSLYKRGGIAQ